MTPSSARPILRLVTGCSRHPSFVAFIRSRAFGTKRWPIALAALIAASFVCGTQPALAVYLQQGPKLVYTGEPGEVTQGHSVAVASASPTILVGAPFAENAGGFAVVFVRSNGVWTRQGSEIRPTDEIGQGFFGWSVALSADGNTALIGGQGDHGNTGAAWVFVRTNGAWHQQAKLVGSATDYFNQGMSVALSADGNTAIVGGPFGSNNGTTDDAGAAWVFTRTNGTWTQQAKLVGIGVSSNGHFGYSVALSTYGDTAIIGAQQQTAPGAAWVFSRSGGVWSQKAMLVGGAAIGNSGQGLSVAISGEGDTALVGGPYDNNYAGATWVFARSGNGWVQQAKLVGSGAIGNARQGSSVALPFSDTGPALIGGPGDNGIGAAWLFTRSSGLWTQRQKLVGSGAVGTAAYDPGEGQSVALSQLDATGADATIAVLGGSGDTNLLGATWVFAAHGAAVSHDFQGDGKSDILWRHSDGEVAMWLMNGTTPTSQANVGLVSTAWQIAGTASLVQSTGDFDHDGNADILWRHSNGDVAIWLMNGTTPAKQTDIGNIPTDWQFAGVADFDGDGKADILWRHTGGDVAIWLMDGTDVKIGPPDIGNVPSAWQIAGVADFDGDGKADILWRNTNGDVAIWLMNGTSPKSQVDIGNVPTAWQIAGASDFDGDGKADILWRNTNGDVAIWEMNGTTAKLQVDIGSVPTAWQIVSTGDYDGDGKADILWRHSNGDVAIWEMNGTTSKLQAVIGNISTAWSVVE